ncbi:hypothetical protein Q7P37_009376 [Cladosporium fusiforme]
MATLSLYNIAFVLIAYISYRIISGVISQRRFKAFAKQHGCEEPLDITSNFPYGWRQLRRLLRARSTGEDILDDILAPDLKDAHTIKKRVIDGDVMYMTADPTNLQALLANQFNDFETGPTRRAVFYPLLGNSIFSSDGATWKHSRALLRPFFSRENINNLAATSQAADALIRTLGEPEAETGWTSGRDAMPLFFCFTMDTATDFLFGENVGALAAVEKSGDASSDSSAEGKAKGDDDGATAASQDFADAIRLTGDFTVWRIRLQSLYWLVDGFRFRSAIRTIWRFVDGFVDKAIAKAEAQGGKDAVEGKEANGLLEALVAQTKDRKHLIAESLAVMMAGRDTTAGLLGWCLLRLALHPEIYSTLRETILRDFPGDSQPTFAQLKSCRPLQHFIQEVLRLHPTVPINNRMATKDTTLPVGGGSDKRSPIAVKAGQTVVFSVYVMHRRKDLWGEDALEFRPSRWEERVPAWQWLPFSGGPRVCLGMQFALTEAAFLLVRLLREFDGVEALDKEEMKRMRKGISLTMAPADGVKVRFHKAAA